MWRAIWANRCSARPMKAWPAIAVRSWEEWRTTNRGGLEDTSDTHDARMIWKYQRLYTFCEVHGISKYHLHPPGDPNMRAEPSAVWILPNELTESGNSHALGNRPVFTLAVICVFAGKDRINIDHLRRDGYVCFSASALRCFSASCRCNSASLRNRHVSCAVNTALSRVVSIAEILASRPVI